MLKFDIPFLFNEYKAIMLFTASADRKGQLSVLLESAIK